MAVYLTFQVDPSWHFLTDMNSGILSGICIDLLLDGLFNITSTMQSDILSGILAGWQEGCGPCRREGSRVAPLFKSRDPHLAGAEKCQ